MQVSSPTSAPVAPATSSLVEQIKRQAAVLADGSGASNDQKIDAYVAISKAIADSASTGSGWFQQSTQADRDAVNTIMGNSSMAQQVRQAADDFIARGMRANRASNVMAGQLDYLNGLSEAQQKMIFAGSASLEQTGSIESWKAFLQQNADSRERQMAAEAAEQPAVKVTLSDRAKAALKDARTTDADAEGVDPAAVLSFDKPDWGDGIAGAALRMLEKAAESRAEAAKKAKTRKAEADRAFSAGDKVDTSA